MPTYTALPLGFAAAPILAAADLTATPASPGKISQQFALQSFLIVNLQAIWLLRIFDHAQQPSMA